VPPKRKKKYRIVALDTYIYNSLLLTAALYLRELGLFIELSLKFLPPPKH
jgi:hypothetical protein